MKTMEAVWRHGVDDWRKAEEIRDIANADERNRIRLIERERNYLAATRGKSFDSERKYIVISVYFNAATAGMEIDETGWRTKDEAKRHGEYLLEYGNCEYCFIAKREDGERILPSRRG